MKIATYYLAAILANYVILCALMGQPLWEGPLTRMQPPQDVSMLEARSYQVGESQVTVARAKGADGQWKTCKLVSNAGGAEMVCK
jgi:hypothetical protein